MQVCLALAEVSVSRHIVRTYHKEHDIGLSALYGVLCLELFEQTVFAPAWNRVLLHDSIAAVARVVVVVLNILPVEAEACAVASLGTALTSALLPSTVIFLKNTVFCY